MRRSIPRPVRGAAILVALLLAGLALAGCWNPFSPRVLGRGISTPPPVPNTASNVLRLFEWAYNNRSYSEYHELFTADYQFVFAALDTNGNKYRDDPFTRDDELESTRKLFEGGGPDQPAASQITLVLDKSFNVQNDTRTGKYDPERRKSITTQVNLTITTVDGASTNVNGKVTFYLVRGDSAQIPSDLGLGPDINRWYIERWEDYTYAPNPGLVAASALPATAGRPAGGIAARPQLAAFARAGTGTAGAPSVTAGGRHAGTAAVQSGFESWGAVKAWYDTPPGFAATR